MIFLLTLNIDAILTQGDNDHALVEVNQQDDVKAFQVKTILYCLDQMQQPLDEKAIQAFLEKSADEIIPQWLDALEQSQNRYEALFSSEVREKLLKKESIPQIMIPPKSIPKLYERWLRLKSALEETPQKTALELLITVDPLVGLRYQEVFEQEKNPLSRFHTVASPAYFFMPKVGHYKTLVTSCQLLKTQAISEKLLVTTRQYSPLEAKKELYQAIEQMQSVDECAKRLERGDSQLFQTIALTTVKEAILKKSDFKQLEVKQQQKLIESWLNKKEGIIGLQNLTLTNLTEIKTKDLENLFKHSPDLQFLRLSGLSNITTLSFLESAGKQLKTLTLNQMNGLTHLLLMQPQALLKLPNLKTLQIEVASLSDIQIKAPQLSHLILGDLPRCQTLDLPQTQQLQRLKIHDCPLLSAKSIFQVLENNPSLRLENCEVEDWLKKNPEDLTSLLTKQLTDPDLTDTTLYQVAGMIAGLGLKTLSLTFSGALLDVLRRLSVLIYATGLETIHVKTLETNEPRVITLIVGQWRALANRFDLIVDGIMLTLTMVGKTETESTILIAIGQTLSMPFKFEAPGKLTVVCQGGQNFHALLSLLFNLSPARVCWHNLDTTLTWVPIRVLDRLLNALLEDPAISVRQTAAQALGRLKQATPTVIKAVLKALEDQESSVRQTAAQALVQLGQAIPQSYLDTLLKALEDQDSSVHQAAAAQALVQLDQGRPIVIEILLKALEGNDKAIRQASVEVMGQIKQVTPLVVNTLLKTLRDENERSILPIFYSL